MAKLQENNNAGALSHIRIVELGDIPASYAARLLAKPRQSLTLR